MTQQLRISREKCPKNHVIDGLRKKYLNATNTSQDLKKRVNYTQLVCIHLCGKKILTTSRKILTARFEIVNISYKGN